MLHPALTQALAAAHIEDLHRAAARRHTIRLAGRVVGEPRVTATPLAILRSASTRLRGRRAPQAEGMTRTEIPQATLWPCQSAIDVRSGRRLGIDPARAAPPRAGCRRRDPLDDRVSDEAGSSLSAKARNVTPRSAPAGRLVLRRPRRSAR
jgi:hypothetical protein